MESSGHIAVSDLKGPSIQRQDICLLFIKTVGNLDKRSNIQPFTKNTFQSIGRESRPESPHLSLNDAGLHPVAPFVKLNKRRLRFVKCVDVDAVSP